MFSQVRLGTLLWSAGLVLVGLFLLLFNFGLFARVEPIAQYSLAALFATGAAIFLLSYFARGRDWAQLIPFWTLLALGVMTAASTVPALDPRITVSLLFWGLALAFGNIYLLDRQRRWWAVVPGGILLVIGVVIGLSAWVVSLETLAAILFGGIGLVFLALYWLAGRPRQWWTLAPGTALLVFGLFLLTSGNERSGVLLRLWPLVLILAGIGIGIGGYRQRPVDRLAVNSAPSMRDRSRSTQGHDAVHSPAQLGDYTQPAPGAAIDVLPEPDE